MEFHEEFTPEMEEEEPDEVEEDLPAEGVVRKRSSETEAVEASTS